MSESIERSLFSERLVLEPIGVRHAESLFDVLQDPTLYTFVPTEPPGSVAQLEARYAVLARRRSPDGLEVWLNWALRLTSAGSYVGTVQATVRPDRTALLAYELGAPYRGAGSASEACRTVLSELADSFGVGEVLAYVDTRNERSYRLLERLGFERVAVIEGADHFKGSSSDEYQYRWALADRAEFTAEDTEGTEI